MAQYYRPPGRNTARSVALTPWAQGLLLTTWPGPVAWNFNGTALASVALPALSYLPFGFSAAAEDGSGDAWIAGYFGGAIRIAAGGATTSYAYPTNAFFSGVAWVGAKPYFLRTNGDVYTLSGSSLIQMSGSFSEEASALSTDGVKLYAALPTSSQLGVMTFTAPVSGSVAKVATPMTVPATVTASASGVAVGGWDLAALASGATALATSPDGTLVAAVDAVAGKLMLLRGTDPAWTIHQVISGLTAPVDVEWVSGGEQVMVSETARVHLYDLNAGTLDPGQTLTLSAPTALAVTPNGATVLACLPASNLVQVLRNTLNVWSADETIGITNTPSAIVAISNTQMVCAYVPLSSDGGLRWVHESSGTWSVQFSVTGLLYAVSGIAIDNSANVYACGTTGAGPFTGHLTAARTTGIVATNTYGGRGDAVFWEQGQIAVLDTDPA